MESIQLVPAPSGRACFPALPEERRALLHHGIPSPSKREICRICTGIDLQRYEEGMASLKAAMWVHDEQRERQTQMTEKNSQKYDSRIRDGIALEAPRAKNQD